MFRPSLDEAYRKRQNEDDRLIEPSFLDSHKRLEFNYRLSDQDDYIENVFYLSSITLNKLAILSKELFSFAESLDLFSEKISISIYSRSNKRGRSGENIP